MPEGTNGRLRFAAWLALAALVASADQATKWIMVQWLGSGSVVTVTDFFKLILVHNPGAAFSFLADQPGWQRWFFVVLGVVICGWLLALTWQHRAERALPLAFSLIIGGAVGNIYDRIAHGAVVDFLYFHVGKYGWPAFNLADSAITVGVVLMLWSQFRPHRSTKETAR